MGDMLSKVQSGKKFNIYKWLLTLTLHYNHKKYWKMRSEVINPKSKKFILIIYLYLYRIKRMDAFE